MDKYQLADGEICVETGPPPCLAEETEDFSSSLPPGQGRGKRVLGIRLRRGGEVFFFHDEELEARIGAWVLLTFEQGQALGEIESIRYGDDIGIAPGKTIPNTELSPATAADVARRTENAILAAEAVAFCKTCVRQRGLDMKLVDVEVLHDRSKIIFYFTAPARIDFRELVKDLVRNYRTRIELRQIGVRHETQMIGALGNCGMVCCCHRYLRKFAPVTIRMAKEQNLFLNPVKLSGMCGRLLCCLSFEQGNYESFNKSCPKPGKRYGTSLGVMRIVRANMFTRTISALKDNGEEVEFGLDEWEELGARRMENVSQDDGRAAGAGGEAAALADERAALEGEGYLLQDDELDFPADGRDKDRKPEKAKRRRKHY
ncbi:MAG: hypothetical protein LBU06_03565 [Desulfovibrio sp.]|jgi:cell fate regulator YaaT (PSP1 superfamily)|nr:hypothetical protein [Desulfovibrio sp.]